MVCSLFDCPFTRQKWRQRYSEKLQLFQPWKLNANANKCGPARVILVGPHTLFPYVLTLN